MRAHNNNLHIATHILCSPDRALSPTPEQRMGLFGTAKGSEKWNFDSIRTSDTNKQNKRLDTDSMATTTGAFLTQTSPTGSKLAFPMDIGGSIFDLPSQRVMRDPQARRAPRGAAVASKRNTDFESGKPSPSNSFADKANEQHSSMMQGPAVSTPASPDKEPAVDGGKHGGGDSDSSFDEEEFFQRNLVPSEDAVSDQQQGEADDGKRQGSKIGKGGPGEAQESSEDEDDDAQSGDTDGEDDPPEQLKKPTPKDVQKMQQKVKKDRESLRAAKASADEAEERSNTAARMAKRTRPVHKLYQTHNTKHKVEDLDMVVPMMEQLVQTLLQSNPGDEDSTAHFETRSNTGPYSLRRIDSRPNYVVDKPLASEPSDIDESDREAPGMEIGHEEDIPVGEGDEERALQEEIEYEQDGMLERKQARERGVAGTGAYDEDGGFVVNNDSELPLAGGAVGELDDEEETATTSESSRSSESSQFSVS